MTDKELIKNQGNQVVRSEPYPGATLNLPLPNKGHETLGTELEAIFGLDHSDENQVELHLLGLLETFYPINGKPDEVAENAFERFADWLSHQDARGRLAIENPDHAARMMVAMTFGGVAVNRKIGEPTLSGPDLIAFVRKSISVFLRGVAVPHS